MSHWFASWQGCAAQSRWEFSQFHVARCCSSCKSLLPSARSGLLTQWDTDSDGLFQNRNRFDPPVVAARAHINVDEEPAFASRVARPASEVAVGSPAQSLVEALHSST